MKKISILFISIIFLNNLNSIIPSAIKAALIYKYPDQYSNPILLGKGPEREVWGSTANELAVKGTLSKTLCGKYTNEFTILKKLQDSLTRYNTDTTFLNRASFPKPNRLEIVSETCLLFMERLYPLKESVSGYLTQMYLRYRTYNKNDISESEIKGEFIGYDEVEKIVNNYPRVSSQLINIQQICYDLGKLTAIMHLGAKVDGLGAQIGLAQQSKNSRYYKIFILSFFQSNDISKFFNKPTDTNIQTIVDSLFESMNADYYFPMPNVAGFSNFRQGYFDFADNMTRTSNRAIYTTITNKLFDKYINEWIKQYLITYYVRDNQYLRDNFYNYQQAIINDPTLLNGVTKDITQILQKNNWYVDEQNQYNNRELYNAINTKLVQLLNASDISDIANKLKTRNSYPR
ncbi:MAG: hypothetical protein ABIA74_00290 [bacterium]